MKNSAGVGCWLLLVVVAAAAVGFLLAEKSVCVFC